MNTLYAIREIYLEGFKNLGNLIIKRGFQAFSWFSLAMFIVVLYAFFFRLVTGYAFD